MIFEQFNRRRASALFGVPTIFSAIVSAIFLGGLMSGCSNCPALACSPTISLTISEELAALGPIEIALDGEPIECSSELCSMHALGDGGVAYWIERPAEKVEVFILDEEGELIEHFIETPRYQESELEVFPDCDDRCPDYALIALP